MKKKKIKLLLPSTAIIIALALLVGAGIISTFSNTLVSEQITFTADESIVRQFQINKNLEVRDYLGAASNMYIKGGEENAIIGHQGRIVLQDGIYPTNDTALNNATPSDGNNVGGFGWSASGNNPQYDSGNPYFGNLSIKLNPATTNSAMSITGLNNGSFNGTVVVHFKDNQSTEAKWYIQIESQTAQQVRLGKRDTVSTTEYVYTDSGNFVCNENTINYYTNFTQFAWVFNKTGNGGNLWLYQRGSLS